LSTKIAMAALLLVLLQSIESATAQGSYQFGMLPAVNLNSKLKKDWTLNTRVESRQLFQSGQLGAGAEGKYEYVLTDLSMVAAKKIGLNSRLAGGYLMRLEEGEVTHRFIQQYIIVQKLSGFRLAHRLVSDQTFSRSEKVEVRLRYRITAEIPLNGRTLDAREFYLKINNEYVNSFQTKEYDKEIRLVPLLGYDATEHLKIEGGLDYRVDSFFRNAARHSFWVTMNVFIDI
jgi:hypothetical protein